ncbi:MAG: hypothetical protein WEB52_11710 [Dehalococcoidia bacterium]
MKSLVLNVLRDSPMDSDGVEGQVSEIVGLVGSLLKGAVGACLRGLSNDGLVTRDDGLYQVTPAAASLIDNAAAQHRRLFDLFRDQTRLDLEREWADVDEASRERAVDTAHEALISVFDERGVEIVNAVFGVAPVARRGSASLFSTLAAAGSTLGSDELRYRFVAYMARLLTDPAPSQRSYVEHLAISFFSIHALAMDPEGHRFQSEYLSGRTLLVDSNVLIPAVPASGTFSPQMRSLLASAKTHGVPLITIQGFVDEVFRHAMWAHDLVEAYGDDSVEVLQAARGEGFRRNTFLDGFVLHAVGNPRPKFRAYLRHCLDGNDFTRENLAQYIQDVLGVATFSFETITKSHHQAFVDRDETEEFIRESAAERLIEKSDVRIKAEAEAYATVANWDALKDEKEEDPTRAWDIAVLSQGGFLNRVARFGPRPIDRYVVVAPDALYGFLLRSGTRPSSRSSFRELIVSPLFDSSAHFVDKQKYREFFARLIYDADREFREHLNEFQTKIDSELKPEFFDEIEPLDRPYFLSSLTAQSQRRDLVGTNQQLAVELGEAQRTIKKQDKLIRNIESAVARKHRKKAAREALATRSGGAGAGGHENKRKKGSKRKR